VKITVGHVFLVALMTDLATGLGALPFFFVRSMSRRWQGWAYAAAGGMMISASVFSLAEHGLGRGGAWQAVAGMLAGSGFYWWSARWVKSREWSIERLGHNESRQAVLLLGAMFVHSIPEGMAVSLPLRARGVSALRCVGYAILTSVPQPLAAVPAYLLVDLFQPLLPAGLGFAGGAMIFLVAAELLPESLEMCSRDECAWGVMIGLVLMLLVTSSLGLLAGAG